MPLACSSEPGQVRTATGNRAEDHHKPPMEGLRSSGRSVLQNYISGVEGGVTVPRAGFYGPISSRKASMLPALLRLPPPKLTVFLK
jgi:hypothetical protein